MNILLFSATGMVGDGVLLWLIASPIQYVGHNCDGRQQTVLRKTQATEALPPWPRQAVPFALPRP